MSGFVYPENAGKGTFIYVIDGGINLQVKNVSKIISGEPQNMVFLKQYDFG